jgi:hypothetical protein
MKRSSESLEAGFTAPNRRLRSCPDSEAGKDDLFDGKHRKTADDLKTLRSQIHEFGNLEARVSLVVPCMGEKHQVTLEVQECGNFYRFLVLGSAKVDALHRFPFVVGDGICLSLKGAQSRMRAQSFPSGYLPIALTYDNGFAAKLTSGPNAGRVFNTWEGMLQ